MARQSRPAASASWTVANSAFHGTTWPAISRDIASAGPDTKAGSPIPDGISIMAGNARVNMTGWYCSAASSSQTRPRATCRPRRIPADSRSAILASTGRPPSRRSVACDEGGKNKTAKAASEPVRATHRPGPGRAITMESPPSTRMLLASWTSR